MQYAPPARTPPGFEDKMGTVLKSTTALAGLATFALSGQPWLAAGIQAFAVGFAVSAGGKIGQALGSVAGWIAGEAIDAGVGALSKAFNAVAGKSVFNPPKNALAPVLLTVAGMAGGAYHIGHLGHDLVTSPGRALDTIQQAEKFRADVVNSVEDSFDNYKAKRARSQHDYQPGASQRNIERYNQKQKAEQDAQNAKKTPASPKAPGASL